MLSKRIMSMDASGIRAVFDLASKIADPINLSIGLPDFDVPDAIKSAMDRAIAAGRNRYTPSAGIPELRSAVREKCACDHGFEPEDVMITSGTSGGITTALLATVDPGDEVLVPDPFFVSYKQLSLMCGAKPAYYQTYPDFRLRREALEAAATDRAKVLVLNSPANPTGAVLSESEVRMAVEFARERGLIILSDEVYDPFWYDVKPVSPARFYANTITLNGWSKSHAMTGWRVGWAAGPAELINAMVKAQQFTFVCAPAPAQYAALEAFSVDMGPVRTAYGVKRDLACGILRGAFELVEPQGAFYLFPEIRGSATEFVKRALERKVLTIPGDVFSTRDTNIRISFAASNETLQRGCEELAKLHREMFE
jgi:aspartate/methionine/tyrosine aminotransferase